MKSKYPRNRRKGALFIWIGIITLAVGGAFHCLLISDINADLETALGTFQNKIELNQEVSMGIERLSTIPPFLFGVYAIGLASVIGGALIACYNPRANKARHGRACSPPCA
jgi:hypothetical protein